MKPFSLLIKPASADCNLRCAYCFYLGHSALYPETSRHRMSDDVLESLIKSYMATDQPQYSFAWQGGEPTLMGLDFYKRAVEFQQKYGRSGATVANGLQTNAVAVNDDLARHFAKYNFLLGVSLDGPEEIHDQHRCTIDGRGSHADVLRGIECLQRNKVEFNILTLVNSANACRGGEVYRYLRDMGMLYHQYIPCVEFAPDGNLLPFAINGEEWGDFLCSIFDEWIKTDTRTVSVRLFDSILNLMVDGFRNVCHLDKNCCQYFVVEWNGDVYPCDFFVERDLKLGNIESVSWDDLQKSSVYAEFGSRKSNWHAKCDTCKYLTYCHGDCLKHRLSDSSSHLCEGWYRFFEHSLPSFRQLAEIIHRERQAQQLASRKVAAGKVGRNDPCPCGSGKKYKKCCGA